MRERRRFTAFSTLRHIPGRMVANPSAINVGFKRAWCRGVLIMLQESLEASIIACAVPKRRGRKGCPDNRGILWCHEKRCGVLQVQGRNSAESVNLETQKEQCRRARRHQERKSVQRNVRKRKLAKHTKGPSEKGSKKKDGSTRPRRSLHISTRLGSQLTKPRFSERYYSAVITCDSVRGVHLQPLASD